MTRGSEQEPPQDREQRSSERTPLDDEIEEQDCTASERRRDFRHAARFVARAFGELAFVERVLLFGSVARPLEREAPRHHPLRRLAHRGVTVLHECKDVDLAVYVTDTSHLRALQRARTAGLQQVLLQKQIGVAHHQVDVFLFDSGTGRYAGRLCRFRKCPAAKPECRVPGCGATLHLQQHEEFDFDPAEALRDAQELHPRAAADPG